MASNTAATQTTSTEDAAPSPMPNKGPMVCVFCGASPGTSPAHLEAARSLARAFHKHNVSLVYGGGTKGLMGEVARTLTELSGSSAVHGIIPEALLGLERENTDGKIDIQSYGRTTVVSSMHSRKELMAKEVQEGGTGSGFVALSGGYGTLEELMEMITWNQLGLHGKGVLVFNVEGYYDGLLQWVRTAVRAGFVSPGNAGILVEALDAEEVVKELREYKVSEDRFQLDWSEK
ncbi:MAG: hypothetical protein LQ343_006279 [Gyalolechia ehrenbergii]|nr:MAG: hypothetical protein LQ343_006279 [Gyalolechia ehrenbergii]